MILTAFLFVIAVHFRKLLGDAPRGIPTLYSVFSEYTYLTTTFVASPSTATTTTPAGAAIVTLSEAATWLAIV